MIEVFLSIFAGIGLVATTFVFVVGVVSIISWVVEKGERNESK